MDETEQMHWFADQFERHRPLLRAVAYRMLGSRTEADDALQEAWIRTTRSDSQAIDNVSGWLTTLVGRVCIDMLRSRTSRRESPVDSWLPEPVVTDGESNPEEQALLADSVSLALLVVLDQLSPDERLAFVLHDMFGLPFDEIAPVVGRTPAATRQLASRARRRVSGTAVVPDTDLATQRRVVDAFLKAAREGDFDALVSVLHPDVTVRIDAGSRALRVPALLRGTAEVAEFMVANGPRYAASCEPALVNGAAGLVARAPDRSLNAVVGVTVVDEQVLEIHLVIDPVKVAAAQAY